MLTEQGELHATERRRPGEGDPVIAVACKMAIGDLGISKLDAVEGDRTVGDDPPPVGGGDLVRKDAIAGRRLVRPRGQSRVRVEMGA